MLTSTAARQPASTDLNFFSSPKPKGQSSPVPAAVVVKPRIPRKPQTTPHQNPIVSTSSPISTPEASPQPVASSSSASSPLSSPLSSPPQRKRKSPPTLKQPSASSSNSVAALPRQVKRLRTASAQDKPRKRASATSSKSSSRASSRPRSPEPIYRIDRSRSTSLFTAPEPEAPIQNRRWCIDQDGTPGPRHLSSATVVTRLIKSYKAYFRNLDDPTDETFLPQNMPTVELEYPNTNSVERFLLLAPKDKDHYNPIMDLEKSLYTIVECYLSSEQQALFGPLPDDALVDVISPLPSRSPSPSNTGSSTPPLSLPSVSSTPQPIPLLRAVQRAIHRQDGPSFVRAIEQVNDMFRKIKYPTPRAEQNSPTPPIPVLEINHLTENSSPIPSPTYETTNPLMHVVSSWTSQPLPKKVLMRIIDENYQRSVGPHVQKLKQYEAFSSTVYGELLPSLVYEIATLTQLKEDSLFMDLGSGVGNVVVQASLQTGCRSFGVELMPGPARVAKEMMEELKVRCKMWGVRMGEVELEEGNMLNSKRVDELLPQADVVLVDNKVFEESLNEALKPKFLDLKEGAIVVSLSPFVPSLNARLTERNVDDISAIFEVTERSYNSGSVSWGNNGGSYYIHRVDREGYARIREKFELSRSASGGRSTRSRRT